MPSQIDKTYHVVGAGIVGLMSAYYLLDQAEGSIKVNVIEAENAAGQRVTADDPKANLGMATSGGVAPSLSSMTMGVVSFDKPADLHAALAKPYYDWGLAIPQKFSGTFPAVPVGGDGIPLYADQGDRDYVEALGRHLTTPKAEIDRQTGILKDCGRISMGLWDSLYQSGDPELVSILEKAGYESGASHNKLRIIFNYKNDAEAFARATVDDYNKVFKGTPLSTYVTPDQAAGRAPELAAFIEANSHADAGGNREWNKGVQAIDCPGGGIATNVFIPEFAKYLAHKAQQKGCKFEFTSGAKLTGLDEEKTGADGKPFISGIKLDQGGRQVDVPMTADDKLLIASGGNYNLPKDLGLKHPLMAGFSGASLILDVPPAIIKQLEEKNVALPRKAMYLTSGDITLSFKPYEDGTGLHVGAGGVKAFYGSERPKLTDAFPRWAAMQELTIFNGLFPDLISTLLGEDTRKNPITEASVDKLVKSGYARVWTGSRAVSEDLVPVVGPTEKEGGRGELANVFVATGMAGGGVSFSPFMGQTVAALMKGEKPADPAAAAFLDIARPSR